MLNEYTLFGDIDKVKIAKNRLLEFSNLANETNPNGFLLFDSGGKDSGAIKMLAYLSGVKFEIVHNHTTADHPTTVRFVRQEQKHWIELGIQYKIIYPYYKGKRTSMWEMIALKGPHTRLHRWCCDVLKKGGDKKGKCVISGVRWAESAKRKNSRYLYEFPKNTKEICGFNKAEELKKIIDLSKLKNGQFVTNPIIDWSDDEVWEFHKVFNIPYNPLYDNGYKRVGCVGCPMGNNKSELEKMPEYKKLYIYAFQRFLDRRQDLIDPDFWYDGNSIYKWWVENKKTVSKKQLMLENIADIGRNTNNEKI